MEVASNQNLILRVCGATGGVVSVVCLIIRNFYKGWDLGPTNYKYNDQPGYGSLKPLNRLQQKNIIVNKTKPGLRSASNINKRKISGILR